MFVSSTIFEGDISQNIRAGAEKGGNSESKMDDKASQDKLS
jgi:hypothetical protein